MSQLLNYLLLTGIIFCTAGFIFMIYLIKKTASPPLKEPGKETPSESGFLPIKPAWGRYHVHYYSIAILFLAFDMEMAYMYPWAVVYKELGLMALLDMGVFLMILFLGLIYTWNQGGLKRQ